MNEILQDTIKTEEFDRVLCIGAPSIHESLQHTEPKVASFLLDLDIRLVKHLMQYYC